MGISQSQAESLSEIDPQFLQVLEEARPAPQTANPRVNRQNLTDLPLSEVNSQIEKILASRASPLQAIQGEDAYLLARLVMEENTRAEEKETSAWLKRCHAVYLLRTVIVRSTDGDGIDRDKFLWMLFMEHMNSEDIRWEKFAEDILELDAPKASQMYNVWNVYIEQLRWDVALLQQRGKSKLQRALGYYRRLLHQGLTDDKLTEQIVNGATWNEIDLYVKSNKPDYGKTPWLRPVKLTHGPEQTSLQLEYTTYEARMGKNHLPYEVSFTDKAVIIIHGRLDKRRAMAQHFASKLGVFLEPERGDD